jgi:hypothetical protein
MAFKSVHTLPTEDDEMEECCTLLDSEDVAGVLEIILLETGLDKDDEVRDEDVVGVLLELAELCGLAEPEPDPPPHAVK